MAGTRDYYDTLGVSKEAGEVEIKSAYRKLAMQYHPDRNPGDKACEDKFKEINEAYSCLSDANKRAHYDRFGTTEPGMGGFGGGFGAGFGGFSADFTDVFDNIFGDFFGGFGGRRRDARTRGSDLRFDLGIDLFEAATGVEQVIDVMRWENCTSCDGTGSKSKNRTTCSDCNGRGQVRYQQGFFSISRTCSKCNGSGAVVADPCGDCYGEGKKQNPRKVSVKIPPGVDTGTRLKMTGEGEPGEHGGPPGDLYIMIGVKRHEFFRREGDNIYCEVPLTFPQASMGAEIEVPGLSGDHKLKIPAGTQPGMAFSLRGKGMPRLGSRGKGDQIVVVNVAVPKNLSRKQKELIEEFEKISKENPHEDFKTRLKNIFAGS
jgi:molecular chaperone DnaJ